MMPNYKGKVTFLKEGEAIELGGRSLDILFTPDIPRIHYIY
jgi:hypothetical protein